MKTSKWFYGIALASLVAFTAAADNVPATTTTSSTTTTSTTTQNNLIIQGNTGSGCNSQAPKPVTKPVTTVPAQTYNNGVVNPGT